MTDHHSPDVAVLEALDDESCRCILETLTGQALTAKEIADVCDLPLSSTYRKIDCLVEASMVEESTRVRLHEKHVKEYRTTINQVVVTIDDDAGIRTFVRERTLTEGDWSATADDGRSTAAADTGSDATDDRGAGDAAGHLADIDAVETLSLPQSDRLVVVARESRERPGSDEQPVSD